MNEEESKQAQHLQRLAKLVPRTRKQRYLLSMNEDDFRDKVVRPLFLQQGYTDGRETCGPKEQGKDCYFTRTAEISGTDIFVIQTKVGRITKSARAKDNLDNLVAQLRTALSTSVPLVRDKKKRLPLAGYLVASGEINDTARTHILDQLSDPRVKFLDVEDLIPLIDRHMPELWLDIDSDALSYFRTICTAIERGGDLLSAGLSIANDNSNACVLDDAYTTISVFRNRPKQPVKGRKLRKKSDPSMADNFFPASSLVNEGSRLLLVVGEGGSGKTTALKRIAYDLARREIEEPTQLRVPILLKARDLAEDTSSTLLDHALRRIHILDPASKQPFTNKDLAEGRVIFMIDGVDELGTDDRSNEVFALILSFHSQYPKCQIIATSRATNYTSSSSHLQAFTRYGIAPFNFVQAEKIIRYLAKQQSLNVDDSGEILRRLQDIHGIALTPLIVTIFAITSDVNKRDIPPNITELFKKYTELMLGRWDEGKSLDQQIQAPVKDLVLQQIAFRMHEQRKTSIAVADFKEEVFSELKSRGLFIEQMSMLYEEIVERSGLFRFDAERVEFRHLLFQEFFAGRAIPNPEYIKPILDDDWWKRSIVFYFGEHPNDIDSLRTLAESLSEADPNKAFTAATTVGFALQACYFGHVEDKYEVYSRVIRSIVEARTNPEFGGKYHKVPVFLTLMSFFRAQESLALSNLALFVERIHESLLETYKDQSEKCEEVRFWLLTGLLESGLYEVANIYLQRFRPHGESAMLLFPLRLGIATARNSRVLSDEAKASLKELSKLARVRYFEIAQQFVQEVEREGRTLEKLSKEERPASEALENTPTDTETASDPESSGRDE